MNLVNPFLTFLFLIFFLDSCTSYAPYPPDTDTSTRALIIFIVALCVVSIFIRKASIKTRAVVVLIVSIPMFVVLITTGVLVDAINHFFLVSILVFALFVFMFGWLFRSR
jgi:hypothetical protein